MRRAVMLGVALAVVAAAPAQADELVTGLDADLRWDKPAVTVKPGETVKWSFAGTQLPHNVQPAAGEGWMAASPPGAPAQDWEHTFDAEGIYNYVCLVHPSTMKGTVTVATNPGAAPTPTPVPDSQKPYTNDDTTPVTLEKVEVDDDAPRLTAVSARRVGRSARVRFRVSEESSVVVRFKRNGRTVRMVQWTGDGTRGLTVRMRSGRYRVEVRATDIAGNRSPIRSTRVTVR